VDLQFAKQTYEQRISNFTNPTAQALLRTIVGKQSNLSISVDVVQKDLALSIIDAVGPYVCLVKTHIDILEDFDHTFVEALQKLAEKHNFLIFEDRKFADIGNTVALQYSRGIYKIASWAHITNAHPVPGPSVVEGLASVGMPLGRGLLLLAEMSSRGTLAAGTYSEQGVEMARKYRDFTIGFIAMRRPTDAEDFLIMTPGVGLHSKRDDLGQQYRTPREVVYDSGCDIIIVGRGIFAGISDPEQIARNAKTYRDEGWKAYLERIGKAPQ